MNLRILPGALTGTVRAPASKSAAHRALICACLAGGRTVAGLDLSEDLSATLECMRSLGAQAEIDGGDVQIAGFTSAHGAVLDCGESGSTLRFLLPVAGVLGAEAVFCGRGRLPERPYSALTAQMAEHGMRFDRETGLPLTCEGRLRGGRYRLPGNVSSQFLSGLLLALPLAEEDSVIELTSPLESCSYVTLTVQIMRAFGVNVREETCAFCVSGGQQYVPRNIVVEGDYSNAAFWMAAGARGGDVTVTGLNPDSVQGDSAFAELLSRMGARVERMGNCVRVRPGKLSAIRADVSQIPDLVPILAVVLAHAEGESKLYNAARLRIKECDRLHATAENLTALGVWVEEGADFLTIRGERSFLPARVSGWNDHRMVMSMAIAGAFGSGIEIEGCQAVGKSYPRFFEDLSALGGRAETVIE